MQEAVGDVGQIMQPVAQVRIGLPLQFRPRVVLHSLDCRFGGQTRTHRLAQPPQPAAVMRDHAESLEHVAVLAGLAVVASVDEVVDRGAHRADRRLEPLQFRIDVVGDDFRHRHARLMHDHMAETEAVGDALTLQGHGPPNGNRRALRGDALELARGDHLGKKHRGGLESLDLFLRIGAPRAVLHHEHANRRAAAQNRHAKERLIDLFARLGFVGERRMVLGVGQRERLGARGDETDQALPGFHRRQVDRFTIEAFGRKQLHSAVGSDDVEGADLGDHIGGDQDDDAVEARLCGDRLRHDLAEPPQQETRTARRAHSKSSFVVA